MTASRKRRKAGTITGGTSLARPRVLVAGAGGIGYGTALALAATHRVTVIDSDADRLARLPRDQVVPRRVDVRDQATLIEALRGQYAVVSGLPYHLTWNLAVAARAANDNQGVHYLDATEDVETTQRLIAMAEGAPRAFIPQCGLAPGFPSVVARDLVERFERAGGRARRVIIRVGALPVYPQAPLNYACTWSLRGVAHEYLAPCEVIADGVPARTAALLDLEPFLFDGTEYEAFNTSGGLGTLCEALKGRVDALNYKSVRYKGHCDAIRRQLIGVAPERQEEHLVQYLQDHAPATDQDVVLFLVTVTGDAGPAAAGCGLRQETYALKIRHRREAGGTVVPAIRIATVAGITTMLDLLERHHLPQRGLVRQEDAGLQHYLDSPFAGPFRLTA